MHWIKFKFFACRCITRKLEGFNGSDSSFEINPIYFRVEFTKDLDELKNTLFLKSIGLTSNDESKLLKSFYPTSDASTCQNFKI